jgi:4-hydroxy-3-methylbut-2-en-1-yl diphosphate reductase
VSAAPGGGRAGQLLVAAPMRIEAALIASASRTLLGGLPLLGAGARAGGAAAAGAARRGAPLVRKTGMGPGRSRAAAGELAAANARAMLVLGFCGGLDASSVPGEVIVAEEVYSAEDEGHEPQRVRCELAGELIQQLTGRGLKVRAGNVVCVSRLALGERRTQLHAGGAIAVDMESVWLSAGAGGRPFGVVRVVLDSPEHELLRVRAVAGALRAAGALRRVAGALHGWAPAQ